VRVHDFAYGIQLFRHGLPPASLNERSKLV
jgi:hypothetical protein